jgi:tetratricopeptide repeat protein
MGHFGGVFGIKTGLSELLNGSLHLSVAVGLAELGRHAAALESLEAGLAVRPDDPSALANKGIVLSELGRHEDALKALNRAFEVRPPTPTCLPTREAYWANWESTTRPWRLSMPPSRLGRITNSPFAIRSLPSPSKARKKRRPSISIKAGVTGSDCRTRGPCWRNLPRVQGKSRRNSLACVLGGRLSHLLGKSTADVLLTKLPIPTSGASCFCGFCRKNKEPTSGLEPLTSPHYE